MIDAINRFFGSILAAFDSFTGHYLLALFLFALMIKIILCPFGIKQQKNSVKQARLKPKEMAIRSKYKGRTDQPTMQKMQNEIMDLYQKEGYNPMGGCLPIVLQIPVFLALYWVLLASVELRGSGWILWIKDLAAPDPWFILPLIMMATMFIQVKLNPKPADPTQAKMMLIMPLVFSVMFFIFASGLVLYWLTNNILSIAQQWWVNKQIDEERAKRKAAKEAKKKSS